MMKCVGIRVSIRCIDHSLRATIRVTQSRCVSYCSGRPFENTLRGCHLYRSLQERLRQRAVFAVRPIADRPLVMVFAERESRVFHRILVLTPSPPKLLSRCRLAHIGRSAARRYPLGFSKVQSVHCSVPNFCIAGHEGPILQREGKVIRKLNPDRIPFQSVLNQIYRGRLVQSCRLQGPRVGIRTNLEVSDQIINPCVDEFWDAGSGRKPTCGMVVPNTVV